MNEFDQTWKGQKPRNTHLTALTIKDYYTHFKGYNITIPAGSVVTCMTACGIDPDYHFWNDYEGIAFNLTGFKDSTLKHDLKYYGLNIPAEFCDPYGKIKVKKTGEAVAVTIKDEPSRKLPELEKDYYQKKFKEFFNYPAIVPIETPWKMDLCLFAVFCFFVFWLLSMLHNIGGE